MIIADQNGKRITDRRLLGSYASNPKLKELKEPDNHHDGDLFKLGTRVKFKNTQKGW